MIRILLVDDHALFREGLVSLLNGQPDLEVVGQAGSVKEAIEQTEQLEPDLILMDFGLPDGTGLEATQAILARRPGTNIVFLTVHEEDDRLFAAIRCGAKGYLLKNVPVARLLTFIRGVVQGKAALTREMTSRLLVEFARTEPAPEPPAYTVDLTSRELEVLKVLATGATNREIASRLYITESTVKNHVRNILAKLNLRNRREASRYARQHGLVNASQH
ncbi:MAG: DNA-binding response regulator [Chloroflexi bacterium]|nr:MAG: DNA-binding response regulator [Chloroflexota bacterium]